MSLFLHRSGILKPAGSASTTETKNIAANDDDGFDEEESFTSANGTGNLLVGSVFGTELVAGFRFTGFSSGLQGASVSSATLTIEIDSLESTSPAVKIYGEDADSAAAWSSSRAPSSITKTTNSTSVTLNATGSLDIDVTSIVQEIVNRGSWSSDIALCLFENTASPPLFNRTEIEAFEKSGGTPASLEVIYS